MRKSDDPQAGIDLIAQISMGLSAVILAIAFYGGWRDESGQILFGVCLLFLTVGALSK